MESLPPRLLASRPARPAPGPPERIEERYRALFDGLVEAYALQEEIPAQSGRPVDFRFREVNDAWERMMGRRREAVVGRTLRELFEESAARWCDVCAKVALTGETVRFLDHDRAADRWYQVSVFRPFGGVVACVFTDDTPRARAEEELRSSEAKYRRIVETAHEGIWVIDAEEKTSFANRRMAEILGYAPGEMLGRPLYSFLPEGALPDVERRLEHHRMGVSETFERRFRKKDGSGVWTHVSTSPLPSHDGRYAGALAMVTDLSGLKEGEAAAAEAEERFRILAEATSEGIVISAGGTILACNGRMARMHGYDVAEMVGRGLAEFIAPESEGALSEHIRSGSTSRLECVAVRKDGSRFPVAGEGWGGSYQGKPVRITVVRDLSEQRAAEAEIARMNRLYSALIEVNEAIVKDRSPGGLFRDVCRVLVERGGFKMAWMGWRDVATRRVLVVASHGDDTGYLDGIRMYADERPEGLGPTGRAIREGKPFICNDYLEDPSTVPWREAAALAGWRSSAAFPVRVKGEASGVLTVYSPERNYFGDREVALLEEAATDVSYALSNLERESQRRSAEEEIRKLNAALEQRVKERTAALESANEELEAFSYSVSHDLRAPLRAIEGFSAMVVEKHGAEVPAEARRLLGVVRSNAQRMARLIDDLLTFSRSARTPMTSRRVDMTALARSAFEEVTADLEGRGAIDFRLGELPVVRGDAALLRQVWINLLSNAAKFSAGRNPAVVEVDGTEEGAEAVYRVRDNGAGFEMAYADKLFGVFQRLHGMTEFEGTGVGLALVRRIVERHGGRIQAEGEVGKGARFTFFLPAISPPP